MSCFSQNFNPEILSTFVRFVLAVYISANKKILDNWYKSCLKGLSPGNLKATVRKFFWDGMER